MHDGAQCAVHAHPRFHAQHQQVHHRWQVAQDRAASGGAVARQRQIDGKPADRRRYDEQHRAAHAVLDQGGRSESHSQGGADDLPPQ